MASPAPFAKIFSFSSDPNQFTDSHRPVPQRGVAHVTDVGRDAVDAAARETSAACWRTAKSCRSDAPMLASSLREEAQATVSNKPGHRGEREVSRKTIARGMPGRSGVTVVTTLVCLFYFACEAAGASSARDSLRPLISESGTSTANLGQNMQRDRETVFAVIARSEATKQSTLPLRLHGLLRFARNDVECCGCLKFEDEKTRGGRR